MSLQVLKKIANRIVLASLLASQGWAGTRSLNELVGPAGSLPKLSNVLGVDGYVPIVLHKLAHPQLLWVDEEWLREKGFLAHGEALTPEFEEKILDVLAYAGAQADEPAGTFLPDSRVAYADLYGGFGMGTPGTRNRSAGSGRAASEGLLQCKGCGRTTLVAPDADPYHSSGTAVLNEGVLEVLASQIANRELPYGANRVIALVTTDTSASYDAAGTHQEPRVLIFREDPLRPAHLFINRDNQNMPQEERRHSQIIKKLADLLPQKSGGTIQSDKDRVRNGVHELLNRVAETLAYSYARGLHHGAFTPSNFELSGKALDFGSFIQYHGYPKAVRIGWIGPSGDNTIVLRFIREFIQELDDHLEPPLRAMVPTEAAAQKDYLDLYNVHLQREMVRLVGFPDELLKKIPDEKIAPLGASLLSIAEAGNEEVVNASGGNPGPSGTYEVPKILSALARTLQTSRGPFETLRPSLEVALERAGLESAPLRNDLLNGYSQLYADIASQARSQDISETALRSYILKAAEIRNRKIKELMRDENFWNEFAPLMNQFARDKKIAPLRAAMNTALERAKRTFRDADPMTLVLKETSRDDGSKTREVFSLKARPPIRCQDVGL